MEQLTIGIAGLIYSFWWLFLLIAAVLIFLMPFFVFKIRNEMVHLNVEVAQLSRNMATLVKITREVHKDKIPAAQECPGCHGTMVFPYIKCKKCGGEVAWG